MLLPDKLEHIQPHKVVPDLLHCYCGKDFSPPALSLQEVYEKLRQRSCWVLQHSPYLLSLLICQTLSDVMGQHNKAGCITFRATLVDVTVSRCIEMLLFFRRKREKYAFTETVVVWNIMQVLKHQGKKGNILKVKEYLIVNKLEVIFNTGVSVMVPYHMRKLHSSPWHSHYVLHLCRVLA